MIAKAEGADREVDKYLKDAAAENVNKQSLGKKQLAYPIKKISEAEYFLWTFEAPGSAILQLDTKMRLEQDLVLRHLLTTFDPKKAAKVGKMAKVVEIPTTVGTEQKEEEPKARPKVTVTTKIVAANKSQSAIESKESKAKKSTKEISTKVQKKGKAK